MDYRWNDTHGEIAIPWAHIRRVKHLVDNPPHPLPTNLPVEISVPWLYLSDEKNARRHAKLRDMGITHVLSLNSLPSHIVDEVKNDLECVGIQHKQINAEDEEDYDMIANHWEECHDYLKHIKESGGKVLVHCVAGINRSGLIVCAASMIFEKRTLLQVVEDCVKKRGIILWNKSFQRQLCVLAAKEGLLGEKPEGYSDEPMDDVVPPPPKFKLLFDKI